MCNRCFEFYYVQYKNEIEVEHKKKTSRKCVSESVYIFYLFLYMEIEKRQAAFCQTAAEHETSSLPLNVREQKHSLE